MARENRGITGEGSPRTFFLRSYFFVDQVDAGTEFATRLSGAVGKIFEPMIQLNDEEWFQDFKKSQGSFAFGLQRITEERSIRGLEALSEGTIK